MANIQRIHFDNQDINVERIFANHKEALIIYLDDDHDTAGESKIGCFTKLAKNSRLTTILASVLNNLIQKTADPYAKCGTAACETSGGFEPSGN